MALRCAPLHPDLRRLDDRHLAPEARAALRSGSLPSLARPVAPGVFALPLLSADTCRRLVQELQHIEHAAASAGLALLRPNSMNNDGVVLDEVGLGALADDLLERVLAPLGAALFPLVGASLDHLHAFSVEYAPERDRDLSLHIDDAEVTLNVCLGETFEGGHLRVLGQRCFDHADSSVDPDEPGEIAHSPGLALVHAGSLRHLALPVASGHRVNLVLWGRGSRFRRSHGVPARCGPWCRRFPAHGPADPQAER